MNKRGIEINEPKDEEIDFDAWSLRSERWYRQTIYVKTKIVGSIEGCVDASMHGVEEYFLKSKEKLITGVSNSNGKIRPNRKTTKVENKKGKKNNYIDISSNKLTRLHMRRPRNSRDKGTSKEKQNLIS